MLFVKAPSLGSTALTDMRWRDKQEQSFSFSGGPRAELEAERCSPSLNVAPARLIGLASWMKQTVAVVFLAPQVGRGTVPICLTSLLKVSQLHGNLGKKLF